MSQINQLSTIDSLSGTDLIAIFSSENWDARKASLNTLLQFFRSSFAAPNVAVQFSVPTTGFSIPIASGNTSTWCVLQPAGTLAAGTVTLPLNTVTLDGTEVTVTSTQIITAFTLSLNGATAAFGAPTTLAGNAFFKMRYYLATNSWYRIG